VKILITRLFDFNRIGKRFLIKPVERLTIGCVFERFRKVGKFPSNGF